MALRLFNKMRSLFKKKRPRVKQHLKIFQQEHMIRINGILGNKSYAVNRLILRLRGEEEELAFENEHADHHFKFDIDLTTVHHLLKEEEIYDFFLEVTVAKENLTDRQIGKLKIKASIFEDKGGMIYYRYPIRLGRFQNTKTRQLKQASIDGVSYLLYKTVRGNISLAVDREVKQRLIHQVEAVNTKQNEIEITGRLFTRTHKLEKLELLAYGRETNREYYTSVHYVHLQEETAKKYGLNRYTYRTVVNVNDLYIHTEANKVEIYDLYLRPTFENDEEERFIRIGRPTFRAQRRLKSAVAFSGDIAFTASPYYTFRQANLSLQTNHFSKDTYKYLSRLMRWSFFVRLLNRHKKVWLVGELPYKAQDTGYHFFKYMRKQAKDREVYYVIDQDSKERRNVEPLGNVLYTHTKEHIKATLIAKRIIGSHHPDYLYPLRTEEFKRKVKAKKVFLQHGVLGTKNMTANYGKNSPGFETDLFLVSSNFEKETIVNDLGYHPKDVVVTGLSRFDALFKDDVVKKRQLLIIPTWREWLVREDAFLESEYFQRYSELISNKTLHKIAEQHGFEIVFCLHPNMQRFADYFADSPVKIIHQGEVDVQTLLKESAMMITDYSSVAFDFSFLNKPVVYYQFDRRRFLGRAGSHIDLDNDLPGKIVYDEADLIDQVEKHAVKDFAMEAEYRERAKQFLTYRDERANERIFQAIEHQIRRKPLLEKITENNLLRALYKRFRQSKWYLPSMKLLYNFTRTFVPVDRRLVLFESGLGKQYADSPRYIYEELIRRNPEFKVVWVLNKNVRFKNAQTKRVKRLSPSYYYYLARARVWVNNQNFPTYIKKRRATTYLQTWHGTPLKRMLHDLENIFGRGKNYLERVSQAIKQWDYLISPSRYASKAFKSAFKYEGKILEIGYPRNDLFYEDNLKRIKTEVKNRLNLHTDKKIILYAPTFRDNAGKRRNRFRFNLNLDLHYMKEQLGDDYLLLLRMHVVIGHRIKIEEELQDFVIDVSHYQEMQELLAMADILITDYSSVMFDFANTKRPMLFYTYDLEDYRDHIRGFYMDFEKEAPGPLVQTTEELVDRIQNLPQLEKNYREKYAAFYDKFCYLEDGKASQRIVDQLFLEKGKNH